MLLTNLQLRNKLLLTYSIPTSLFALYNLSTTTPYTVKTSSGHLGWKWGFSPLFILYYLFFLFFSLMYNKEYESLVFIFLYLIFLYYFSKEGSAGSVWCLSANIMILYFLLFILVILPLGEILNNKP
jgi:hypothetical protein